MPGVLYDNCLCTGIMQSDPATPSFTIGNGRNRILFVVSGGIYTILSCTYNAVAMTLLSEPYSNMKLYYMLESSLPSAGNYTVNIDYASGSGNRGGIGIISLSNVKQSSAVSNWVTEWGGATSAPSNRTANSQRNLFLGMFLHAYGGGTSISYSVDGSEILRGSYNDSGSSNTGSVAVATKALLQPGAAVETISYETENYDTLRKWGIMLEPAPRRKVFVMN